MNKVLMRAPSGKIYRVDLSNIEKAENDGWQLIDQNTEIKIHTSNGEEKYITPKEYFNEYYTSKENSPNEWTEGVKSASRGLTSFLNIPKLIGLGIDKLGEVQIENALRNGEFGDLSEEEVNDILAKAIAYKGNLANHIPSVEEIADKAGINLTPHPQGNKINRSILEFMGGAVSPVNKITQGVNLLRDVNLFKNFTNTAKTIGAAGAIGGVSGLAQEAGVDPLVADLASSVLVPNIKSIAQSAAQNTAKKALNLAGLGKKSFNPEAYEAFQNLGIQNVPLSYISQSVPAKFLEEYTMKLPVLSNHLNDKINNINYKTVEKAENLLNKIGIKPSDELKDQIKNFYTLAQAGEDGKNILQTPNTANAANEIFKKHIKATDQKAPTVVNALSLSEQYKSKYQPNFVKEWTINGRKTPVSSISPKIAEQIRQQIPEYQSSNGVDFNTIALDHQILNDSINWLNPKKIDIPRHDLRQGIAKDVEEYKTLLKENNKPIPKEILAWEKAKELYHKTENYKDFERILSHAIDFENQGVNLPKLNLILANKKNSPAFKNIFKSEKNADKELKDLRVISKAAKSRNEQKVNASGTATTQAGLNTINEIKKGLGIGAASYAGYRNPLLTGLGILGLGTIPKLLTSDTIAKYAYKNAKGLLPEYDPINRIINSSKKQIPFIIGKDYEQYE